MSVAILPDIREQTCIGCALCVEICTKLDPNVLSVKPVEGWKRGKAFVFPFLTIPALLTFRKSQWLTR